MGLTSFGTFFMMLGCVLFFDGALIALGNVSRSAWRWRPRCERERARARACCGMGARGERWRTQVRLIGTSGTGDKLGSGDAWVSVGARPSV